MGRGRSDREPGVRLLDASGAVPPTRDFTVVFGRDELNVHVAVGVGDRYMSREHGRILLRDGGWILTNDGRLPLRLPGSVNLLTGASTPMPTGYTPIIVKHRHGPAHVLEAVVVAPPHPQSGHRSGSEPTSRPEIWKLTPNERLALLVLSRRYLCHDTYAQPLAWGQAADDLATITGDASWGTRRVERLVEQVRTRLSAAGVPGLTRDEVGEPVGNTLNHNLITELLLTTTLVPPDLAEIDLLDW